MTLRIYLRYLFVILYEQAKCHTVVYHTIFKGYAHFVPRSQQITIALRPIYIWSHSWFVSFAVCLIRGSSHASSLQVSTLLLTLLPLIYLSHIALNVFYITCDELKMKILFILIFCKLSQMGRRHRQLGMWDQKINCSSESVGSLTSFKTVAVKTNRK